MLLFVHGQPETCVGVANDRGARGSIEVFAKLGKVPILLDKDAGKVERGAYGELYSRSLSGSLPGI